MEKFFITILNMSISAGYMIITITAARFLLKKIPKNIICLLWILAGINLICPFSIKSMFSLLPSSEAIPENIVYEAEPSVNIGIPSIDKPVNSVLHEHFPANANNSISKMQIIIFIGSYIWIFGIIVMSAYLCISCIMLKKRVRTAVPFFLYGHKIYLCDDINTPFLFGIFKPRIYVPSNIHGKELEFIVSHEMAHIKRRDYIAKPIGFVILAIHWFNPLVWLAYFLMCRDMEFACDEKVIRNLGMECKKGYSETLLKCSVNKHVINAYPVAFGELAVKKRIINVLSYKKPKFWVLPAGVVICAVIFLCFMTDKNDNLLYDDSGIEANSINSVPSNEINPDEAQNHISAADMDSINSFVNKYATAFCGRDGETILSLYSAKTLNSLEEQGLLDRGEGWVSFGMSSPWPMDYRIISMNENSAHILYYAFTSDPHLTVWSETIEFGVYDDNLSIDSQTLDILDYIVTSEEFYDAYPDGIIDNTMMDYLYNGMGESLNQNALLQSSARILFEPETAAVFLLNLLNNDEKVKCTVYYDEITGTADVEIYFVLDGKTAGVTMIQPYGEYGIWIPQTKK